MGAKKKYAPMTAVLALGVALLAPITSSVTLTPPAAAAVKQSAKMTLLPTIVQPGSTVASAEKAKLSGTVSFKPVRKGRPVIIQRKLGSGAWQKVTTLKQDGKGAVSFTGPAAKSPGSWYTYRGVAEPFSGLPKKASPAQSASRWGVPDFIDEFTGTSLDPTKWSYRAVGVYDPASDRACSASDPGAVTVNDGRVQLWVKPDLARKDPLLGEGPCGSKASHKNVDKYGKAYSNQNWYKTGHISTAGKYDTFRYGVAAARVKFDRNVGAHGSFWLQAPADDDENNDGPAIDGAEIDVVEYFGKDFKQGDVYSFIHYYAKGASTGTKAPDGPLVAARKALGKDDDWFKKYHVFSVEWTPRSYTFRVDGVRTLTLKQGVSQVPEYLILSMLSSGWELENMNPATLPNATEVDWVQVWER